MFDSFARQRERIAQAASLIQFFIDSCPQIWTRVAFLVFFQPKIISSDNLELTFLFQILPITLLKIGVTPVCAQACVVQFHAPIKNKFKRGSFLKGLLPGGGMRSRRMSTSGYRGPFWGITSIPEWTGTRILAHPHT